MAKIHSFWTVQYHLTKYWIYHWNIAFQSRFLLYNTTVPYSAGVVYGVGPNSDWYTDTVTQAHNHKPDHVHNKVVSKQINMIKWLGWMASAEICTVWMTFRVSQVAWPETFKLCYDGISVWICPPKLVKIRSCWTDQHHTHTQPFFCSAVICTVLRRWAGTRKVKPGRVKPIWIYCIKR